MDWLDSSTNDPLVLIPLVSASDAYQVENVTAVG
jgi:hypothetical protein